MREVEKESVCVCVCLQTVCRKNAFLAAHAGVVCVGDVSQEEVGLLPSGRQLQEPGGEETAAAGQENIGH